jgi:hypothetical protein
MFDGMRIERGPFDAKLTHEARCVARALHRVKGISFKALADAFGTDDSAIQKLCNGNKTPYRQIKGENSALGDEAFYNKYVNPEYEVRIAELIAVTAAEKIKKAERKAEIKAAREENRRLGRKSYNLETSDDAEKARVEAAVAKAMAADSTNRGQTPNESQPAPEGGEP